MTIPAADRELADDEALAWLRRQAGGKIEITGAELARRWGWNRHKVYRRVKRWAELGVISREPGDDGNWVIIPVVAEADASNHDGSVKDPAGQDPAGRDLAVRDPAVRDPAAQDLAPPAPASNLPVRAETPAMQTVAVDMREPTGGHPLFVVEAIRRRVGIVRILGGLVLAAIACAIAWFGLNINAWYGATLGKTAEASLWLAGLSVAADALALILPAAARTLWQDGKRGESLIAWGLWGTTIVIALLATIGFASLNIADTTAARGRIADENAGLAERVGRLRAERTAVAETRSVNAIEAELQRAQPRAAAVWHATAGCTDVTRPISGEACADVLKLRQAIGMAQQRDALDAELKQAEQRLAHLPAVTTADPQAETAARLANWVTLDAIHIAPRDVHMARVLGMTLLPQISGLVLMLAMALWQPYRGRESLPHGSACAAVRR